MNDAQKQTASKHATSATSVKHVVLVRPRKGPGEDRVFKGCAPEGT